MEKIIAYSGSSEQERASGLASGGVQEMPILSVKQVNPEAYPIAGAQAAVEKEINASLPSKQPAKKAQLGD